MEIVVRPGAEAAADLVAQIIAKELTTNPRLTLGLATGRTMEAVYARLVQLHRVAKLDFAGCRTFNLDEYVGLAGQHHNSYRHYMNHHLFQHVNIDMANTYLPDGTAQDLTTECANYEQLITAAGGIDLQLLGIGENGHLGFNEPLSAFQSRTRVKILSPLTRTQNASQFSKPEQVPHRAITMGVGTVLDSRRCLLLATGEHKAAIVAKTIEGPITNMISATALQFHPECLIVLDEAAASQLKGLDDYRHYSATQPQYEQVKATSKLETNCQLDETNVCQASLK